jgi:GTP-binding protein
LKVTAKFLTSAVDPEHFPPPGPPEIAFLGRSNVGKSSLLNSLVGTNLARVSNTPGRTQMINFFSVYLTPKLTSPPDTIFADLPGYGYAKVPLEVMGTWSKFVDPYLAERESLRLSICLVDSSIPPQKSDLQLLKWLHKARREFMMVATKADRLTGNKLKQSLRALEQEFGVKPLLYSSKTGAGKDELWKAIRNVLGTEK